jgi:hypothetical protein
VYYTPKHGSWLNQAEIVISLFTRRCLGRRRIPWLAVLRPEAQAWNREMNRDRVIITWKFTRKSARQKFGNKRYNFTFSETYLGQQMKLRIVVEKLLVISQRFFAIPLLRFYALADRIRRILSGSTFQPSQESPCTLNSTSPLSGQTEKLWGKSCHSLC